jgi:hypothetical protein
MKIIQEINTKIPRGRIKINSRKIYAEGSEPTDNQMFVFPSDLNEMNRKGIANIAVHKYGASYYQNTGPSKGPTGRAYAIPVTDDGYPMTGHHINTYLRQFMEFTQREFINFNVEFFICDFSKHMRQRLFEEISPSFKHCYGCYYPESFAEHLMKTDLSEITLTPAL